MTSTCPYICNNKTSYDYCQTTGCINHNVDTYLIVGVEDGWIKVDKKVWDEYEMMKDLDYGIGRYS